MKFLRPLLTCLGIAAFAAAVVLTPPFQTWLARTELDGLPGLQASLGSVWAKFGKVDAEDLKLVLGDAVLTVPSAEVRLPIIETLRSRRYAVGALVAKGWTLDLSRAPADEAEAEAPPREASGGKAPQAAALAAQAAADTFAGILSGWKLPAELSLDGVDLDGEVLVPGGEGRAPVSVHVEIRGGGMAAGREGAFSVDAETVDPETGPLANSGSVHGRLMVAMDSARTVGRAAFTGNVSVRSGRLREDLDVTASASADRAANSEAYALSAARGGRNLAALDARFSAPRQRFEGTWKAGFLDADLAPLLRGRPLPSLAGTGAGSFEVDAGFTGLHARGRVDGVVARMGALVPSMGDTGRANVAATFDVVRSGHVLRFSQGEASYSGGGPALSLKALQPFDVDETTGGVTARDAGSDWLDVSFDGVPAAWLPALPGGLSFDAGRVSGGFLVRATGGGFSLGGRGGPIGVTGASIRGPKGVLAGGLDLTAAMTAELDAKKLTVSWAPLWIDSAGRRLASLEAKGTRAVGAGESMAVSGKWSADLAAIASLPNLPGLAWLPGSTATGEFTGNLGAACDLEGKVDLVGRDPSRTLSATFNADVDPSGAGDFLVPFKVTTGSGVSEISAEGSWGRQRLDPRVELKLTGADVALDQLLLIAGPLAAAGGAPSPARPQPGGGDAPWTRDAVPFWGSWAGSVKVAFDKLRTGDQDFTDVGGTFEIDHGSIELDGGHGEVPPKSLASVEGKLSFDPSEARPYSLKATLAPVANLDSALLLPAQPGQDPVIEGHFTLAGTVTGTGASLGELLDRTREEFQLSCTTGILRILTTNIADAIPEAKEPVADSLDTVGNFVGSVLLGIKGHSIDPSKNKVSKTAEAVLNFTNQVSEIGFDRVSVTAVRGPDRTIRLTDLEMVSPDEHLKGTGEITYSRGLPVSQEPLRLDLRLGVKDVAAKLLASVGLLSQDKDAMGYPLLSQPVVLGGSLLHIDDRQWHDLLAKAATQKTPDSGKGDKAGAAR